MTSKTLALNLLLQLLYMTAWFVIAYRRKRLDTVDTAWGGGFVLAAWLAVWHRSDQLTWLIAVLVTVWGLRLAVHLHGRNRSRRDDPRYRELAARWSGNLWRRAYVSIFLLQGALVWLISLPVILSTSHLTGGLNWLSALGVAVWLTGFVIEAVADRQLTNFLHRKNRPKLMDGGLWRYSRHPNYFGELLQWWAIGLIALQVSYGWLGLLGPAVLSYLILFVSGIPPIEKRREKDASYQAYRQRTSRLLPLPRRS